MDIATTLPLLLGLAWLLPLVSFALIVLVGPIFIPFFIGPAVPASKT